MDKGMDLTVITPSGDCLEGAGSCNELIEVSASAKSVDHNALNQQTRHQRQINSSRIALGDIRSHIGSPCFSVSDAPVGSSQGLSFVQNEDDEDDIDQNHHGCGISCCWSVTPGLRESNLPSDVEDQPLLSGEVGEIFLSRKGRIWKYKNNESTLCSDSPRNLSQKFRPKSFSELVGQDLVARSLLNAISNSRITSFYLFHGPRGTGKTSVSKIFAAALNCLSLEENRPCGLCRECVLLFSGRSRDVKEVDSARINRRDGIRSLIKHSTVPPVSSRFKVFLIDECHLLRAETWAVVVNRFKGLPLQVVFIMITPHLDKLPRSAISHFQRYHFPKIKDADIASRLGKICAEEGLEFEQVALDLIATKSDGSLRVAEMMVEQLSLLGKRITTSLIHELIGIVSDDELLDLLDLALSSDTSNTVRRARELMRSKIDPMQLISQLANIIMDVLAGKCHEGSSEVRRKFFGRHISEASPQQLNNALKILSETEKQLRMSKSQTTWLTVALLQLASVGSSFLDSDDLRLCESTVHPRDGDLCRTSSTSESLKHLVSCACHNNELHKVGRQDSKESMETIWKRAIAICQSRSLRSFLCKQGKLASICFNQGVAVVELEFHQSNHITKVEKSWKLIANALQSILGCNVEIRVNLVPCALMTKYAPWKKPSFSLFSCSRRLHEGSLSATECGTDQSSHSDFTSENDLTRDKSLEICSSSCASQFSHNFCQRQEASTIRSKEGNALSIRMTLSNRSLPDRVLKQRVDSLKEKGISYECQAMTDQEAEKQPGCFSRSLKLPKKDVVIINTLQNNC
ncbi:DNA-directed DNA polymerase [Bertholletia excelsa]